MAGACTIGRVLTVGWLRPDALARAVAVRWAWLSDVDDGALTLLSTDERRAAHRKATPLLQRRALASYALRRLVLSAALGAPARELVFQRGRGGKPELGEGAPHFSVSHAGDLWACAVTTSGPVGLDVEDAEAPLDAAEIVDAAFSVAEQEAFRTMPREQQRRAFFRAWTRKEAYGKRSGDGLTESQRFTVTLGEEALLLADPRRPGEELRVALVDLVLPSPFVGAVACAVEAAAVDLAFWPSGGR